eukprot:scaffold119608_cov57-Phaeocystis_antarctica.AAC.2
MGPEMRKCRGESTCSGSRKCISVQSAARGGGTHLLRRRACRAGALLEPGADVGEQFDLLDGDVGLAHALVAQPELMAAAACRRRRRELQVVRGRHHGGSEGRRIAPAGAQAHAKQIYTENASSRSAALSAPPESSPILARIGPRGQGTTQAALFFDRAAVLPERQHENGKEDADDAVEAQGGLLRLMVEMGKSGVTSQGRSHAGLRAAQAAVPECIAQPRGHRRAYRL